MNISILTFSKGDSYGAVLQSFALNYILREWGYNVEFIHLVWYNSWRQRLLRIITPAASHFEAFRKQYLSSFSEPCLNEGDLIKSISKADLCIVGSDQVWNPDITGKLVEHYFFDFLPEGLPRIAYAASFGNDRWEKDEMVDSIASHLEKFSAISVREKSGVEICHNVFQVEATQVLDPTLLIEDYSSCINIVKAKTKIVSFKFSPSTTYYELLSFFSKELNQEVITMDPIHRNSSYKMLQFHILPFASVEGWLGNIKSASLIVTDSFHCTVFAILHRKQFIVIPADQKRKGRIYSLLSDLGLLDRYYDDIDYVYNSSRWKNQIDYEKVFTIINKKRTESLNFLKRSICDKL